MSTENGSISTKETTILHVNDFLREEFDLNAVKDGPDLASKFALVLVNGATGLTTGEVALLKRKWNNFTVRICADGGSNRWHDAFSGASAENEAERRAFKPDHIIGDLDSARKEVLDLYRSLGTQVTYVASQDNSDLEKSLDLIIELQAKGDLFNSSDKIKVVIMGAFGGRFDQEVANCNTLYVYKDEFESVVLLGGGNSTTLLRGGQHIEHRIQMIPGREGPGCSLLPFGAPVESSYSTGLKWNLNNLRLAVGELVSSSNRAEVDEHGNMSEIVVRASGDLLWSCDLQL